MPHPYFVSLCTEWVLQNGQYFFICSFSCCFFLLRVVV